MKSGKLYFCLFISACFASNVFALMGYGDSNIFTIDNRNLTQVGYGDSNIFTINNRNAITVSATNNWDGTVTVESLSCVNSELFRKDIRAGTKVSLGEFDGGTYEDKLELSQLNKPYKYVLQEDVFNGDTIAASKEVTPEIIMVLVRGYAGNPVSDGIDESYWESEEDEQEKGLVASVKEWFDEEDKRITCWDASKVLHGKKTIDWNYKKLKDFIEQKISDSGLSEDVKIHLFGHSMGGLISRKYACKNESQVLKIFCAQTPHTGSPLGDIASIAEVSSAATYSNFGIFWDINEASLCLTTSYLNGFNDEYKSETPIYSTYSSNYKSVQNSFFLKCGHSLIETLKETSKASLYSGFYPYSSDSDGCVPENSAKGNIFSYSYITFNLKKKEVDISDFFNSGLDHKSCHKHPKVLNQVIRWLGYDAPYVTLEAESLKPMEEQTPQYYVKGFNGTFSSSQPVSESFVLSGSSKAMIQGFGTDPNAVYDLSLQTPAGQTITKDNTNSDVSYTTDNGNIFYEIANPEPGQWTVNLSTSTSETQKYGINIFENEFLSLNLFVQNWCNTGETVDIIAELRDNSGNITGASLETEVILPDGSLESVALLDDGSGADETSNDGVFSGAYTVGSQTGEYNVLCKASDGTAYERTSYASFNVSEPSVSIDGDITDSGIDKDANGFFDCLRFDVPVEVYKSGEYRLTGNVKDCNDVIIAEINSGAISLDNGQGIISAEVSSERITDAGINGPYKFMFGEIISVSDGLTVADFDSYITAKYLLSDFEPKDTDEDGVPDSVELSVGTEINDPDSDNDGATDLEEIGYGGERLAYEPEQDSNPLEKDTDEDQMADGYEIRYGLNPLVDDTEGDIDVDGLTNIEEYQLHTRPDKIDTDDDGRNDKWETDNGADPLVFEEYSIIECDINLDGKVDITDLTILMEEWLCESEESISDVAPENGDGQVNILDFASFANYW
ncbi:choice-of-anchor X domain-containing protein [Sedimentisphaera salicampi]|uniref:PGAP1-like protein n=1 Tax=Sedimentisphaera salicampi TaxID=1941349 RepID=A0A1W6LLA6_9BACT|nr:choice-of-anchor X domain-containing protein [Sedimentisphaera salicampi]ARN56578.1 PGAP1-like protein [Sedimentisphaera salicampi]